MSKDILIGVHNTCNQINLLGEGFRELGYNVFSVSYSQNKFYKDVNKKICIPPMLFPYGCGENIPYDKLSFPEVFNKIFACDIFLFVASKTLLPFLQDLPLLSKMGKKIICSGMGSEVRHAIQAEMFYKHYNIPFPQDIKTGLLNKEKDLNKTGIISIKEDIYTEKVYTVRMTELYADALVTAPGYAGLFLRPYYPIMLAINISEYKPFIPKREKPLVIHAPTWRGFKQTELIFQTLNQLRDEGVSFDFTLVEDKTNEEVIALLEDADVLIDQICFGKCAMLGLEGLASGCCVVGCNHTPSQPIPYEPQPVIGVTRETIYERLKQVLTDKKLRIQYAEAGIEYMQLGIHDPVNVARRLLQYLYRSKLGDYDYYPTFYTEHGEPSLGEVIPEQIKEMTWKVIQKYGLSPDFSPKWLFKAELLPSNILPEDVMSIKRWKLNKHVREYWGWWNKAAEYNYSKHMTAEQKETIKKLTQVARKLENN